MDEKKHYVNVDYIEKFDRKTNQSPSSEVRRPVEVIDLEVENEVLLEEENPQAVKPAIVNR